MKILKKALALVLALAAIICMPVHASAAQESNSYGIDFSKTASVDIYKYDLTSAEKDGVWNSSYVSTGVRDEDGVESILGNTQIVNQLTGNGESYGYASRSQILSRITGLRITNSAPIFSTVSNPAHRRVNSLRQ